MKHRTTIASIATLLALTGSPSARAESVAAKPAGVLASAQLAPLPGQTARGVAKIGVSPDGATRGTIIAVLISAVEKVDVVLSARACGNIQDGTSNTIAISELTVGPQGHGVSVNFGDIKTTRWRAARSLAFVAGEEVLACGALRKLRLAPRSAPVRALTALTPNQLLEPEGIYFGLLGTTYGGDGKSYAAVTTVGKEFDSATHTGRFQFAVTGRACPAAGSPLPRRGFRPLGRSFSWDIDNDGTLNAKAGTAVIELRDVIVTSLRKARAVALVHRAGDGATIEACAPLRRLALVR